MSCLHLCPVLMEARRGRQILWNRSYGRFEPHMWALGAECTLSSGGPSALMLFPLLSPVWYRGSIPQWLVKKDVDLWRAIWTINFKSLSLNFQVTGQIYIPLNEFWIFRILLTWIILKARYFKAHGAQLRQACVHHDGIASWCAIFMSRDSVVFISELYRLTSWSREQPKKRIKNSLFQR